MFGCFSSPDIKKADAAPQKALSRAETRREKKHLKLRKKVERQTSCYGNHGVGFSFSGAGFLFPYFAGVASGLVQLQLITSKTHLAGASAGALIAANVTCGLSPEEGFESCLNFANDCRRNGAKGRLKHALRQHLLNTLPADSHNRVSGRTHVAVTQAVPLKRRIVSEWDSLEDLVDCLVASCHLPRYSDEKMTSPFRGKAHMDGGMLNFIPAIPIKGVMTVGVCCFPKRVLDHLPVKSSIKSLSICPDMFEPQDWQYTIRELMMHAFEPGDDAFLRHLYIRGCKDAVHWARSVGLLSDSPLADARLTSSLPFSAPMHPAIATTKITDSDRISVLSSSMQNSSDEPSLPLSTQSDSTCASFSSVMQHDASHQESQPVDTDRPSAGRVCGLRQRSPMGLPVRTNGNSSSSSEPCTDAIASAGRSMSSSSGLAESGKPTGGVALETSISEGSDIDAVEVVSTLSSSTSCKLSGAGSMELGGKHSLVSQVIHEEQDASVSAASM